jgi:hypothetical protein
VLPPPPLTVSGKYRGTQFTCFTGTKVQILTQRAVAYVINVPAHTQRWQSILSNFACVADLIEVRKWSALPLDHPSVLAGEGVGGGGGGSRSGGGGAAGNSSAELLYAFRSLTLSMLAAWQHWAHDSQSDGGDRDEGGGASHVSRDEGGGSAVGPASGAEEWAFFLEDDVDWHPSLKGRPHAIADALAYGLGIAQKEGLAALGWCEPQYGPMDFWVSDKVQVRRGNGMCGHAYAMTRWRAATLARELFVFKTGDEASDVHIDILLRQWIRKGEGNHFGSWGGVYLLGANLSITSPSPPSASEAAGGPRSPTHTHTNTHQLSHGAPLTQSIPIGTRMAGLLYQDRSRHTSHVKSAAQQQQQLPSM